MSEQNVAVVQQAYAAFGRGNVEGVIDRLSDDIVWEATIGANENVPQSGRREGKAAVREFFRILAESVTFERFEPREFIAQGDRVVVLGFYRGVVQATGRTIESEWVMLYRLQNGLVSEFREFTDSAAINAAYEPRAASTGRQSRLASRVGSQAPVPTSDFRSSDCPYSCSSFLRIVSIAARCSSDTFG